MANRTGIVIAVKTDRLVTSAADVEAKIRRLEQAFSSIDQTITGSKRYWEGEGVSAYQTAYQKKMDIIKTALKRFQENVDDLREIAGVYEQAEREVAENNAALSSEGII